MFCVSFFGSSNRYSLLIQKFLKYKKSFISISRSHDLKNHDVYRSFSIFSSDAFKNFLPLGCFPPSLFAAQKILFPPSMHATIAPSQHSRPFHPFPEKNLFLSLKASFYPLSFFSAPFKVGQYLKKDSSSLPNIFGTQSDLISFICMTRQKCWHQNLLCCMECKNGWRIYVPTNTWPHTR